MFKKSNFSELENTLPVLVSLGLPICNGELYIFNHEQQLIKAIGISGESGLVLRDISFQREDLENHGPELLLNRREWVYPMDKNLHIKFDLTDVYSGLAIFTLSKNMEEGFTTGRQEQAIQLLQSCINRYLQSEKIKKLEEDVTRLQADLADLLRNKEQLEVENSYLAGEIKGEQTHGELIISGKAMQHVSHLIQKVAKSNSTVLILGETGTGKELVARAIHAGSERKHKIMIKVNCAALPPGLIESELFGHEKGSFSGAINRHIGKFELADNGTLFLDEVGEMPPEVQAKLLRAIQEKEIDRIGGSGTIKINVRIIAATNRDLQKYVQDGHFRSDLYYRLNVFPITVPRLRERIEDIEQLANHFIRKFCRISGKRICTLSKNSVDQLLDYDWPGNVRELEHVIERSVLLNTGTIIRHLDLITGGGKLKKTAGQGHFKTLDENERAYILLALEKTNGKIYGKDGAAELLGINFNTLNSRIKKLGIQKGVLLRS